MYKVLSLDTTTTENTTGIQMQRAYIIDRRDRQKEAYITYILADRCKEKRAYIRARRDREKGHTLHTSRQMQRETSIHQSQTGQTEIGIHYLHTSRQMQREKSIHQSQTGQRKGAYIITDRLSCSVSNASLSDLLFMALV